jgi:enolase
MTTKQKAIELVEKYETYLYDKPTTDQEWVNCIECAIIAADQVLLVTDSLEQRVFWKAVRIEILSL